ncbi:G-protein coupled receptor [Biomphalaria glabrata]|nr:G-protein coupled receptor [Biomphalaria glabrata]
MNILEEMSLNLTRFIAFLENSTNTFHSKTPNISNDVPMFLDLTDLIRNLSQRANLIPLDVSEDIKYISMLMEFSYSSLSQCFKVIKYAFSFSFLTIFFQSKLESFHQDKNMISNQTAGRNFSQWFDEGEDLCDLKVYQQLASLTSRMLIEVLKCCVNPTLAAVGFILNLMSMMILREDGFNKPSNILLLGLVTSACFFQISVLNVPEIYEYMSGWKPYKYNKHVCFKRDSQVLLTLKQIFYFFGSWGEIVFTPMYTLITIERLLAVFMPMTFRTLVTKRNVIIAIVFVYVLWLPWVVFKLIIVFIGNVAIAVKIKLTLMKRTKLTSIFRNEQWSKQTTKTL